MNLVFWMLSLEPALSLSSFPSSRGSLVPLCFLALCCFSVTQSCPTLSKLQHSRLCCSSPSLGVCSYPLSWWCHPTISSFVVPFSSCLQPFPASRSFPVSRPFVSGGQSIRASASASVLPMNIQGWFLLGLTGLISLLSRGFSRVFSGTHFEGINSSVLRLFFTAIRVMSSAYLRLLIFIPAIFIPAWVSCRPAFHMMYSAYRLNEQGNNMQP